MGYIKTLFTGQSETSGVVVSETSRLLSTNSVAGHPAVYRHLKSAGAHAEKQQEQAE